MPVTNRITNKINLPEEGIDKYNILEELESRKANDANWREGRSWSLVYFGGTKHDEFLKQAYAAYFSENGISPTAFPSLARLEAEVVSMVLSQLGAKCDEVGTMTSGGTESILLAMKAYRDQAYDSGKKKGKFDPHFTRYTGDLWLHTKECI